MQVNGELHDVDIGSLLVVEGVEQQPLLQRGQRQDIVHSPPGLLQRFDLRLTQLNQWQIGRREPTGARLLGVDCQSGEHFDPALRELIDFLFPEQFSGPGPSRPQHTVLHDCVDR